MEPTFPDLVGAIARAETRARSMPDESEAGERERRLVRALRDHLAELPEQRALVLRWRTGELREVYRGDGGEAA